MARIKTPARREHVARMHTEGQDTEGRSWSEGGGVPAKTKRGVRFRTRKREELDRPASPKNFREGRKGRERVRGRVVLVSDSHE